MTNDAPSDKLQALHARLAAEQRRLITEAAGVDMLPPTTVVARIAQLEGASLAVDAMLEEQRQEPAQTSF